MGFKQLAGRVLLHEIPALLEEFAVEIPEELNFPFTVKLDEKHALHIDLRGYIQKGDQLAQTVGFNVVKNNVVKLEKD